MCLRQEYVRYVRVMSSQSLILISIKGGLIIETEAVATSTVNNFYCSKHWPADYKLKQLQEATDSWHQVFHPVFFYR